MSVNDFAHTLRGVFFRRFPNAERLFQGAGTQYGPLARTNHDLEERWRAVVQPLEHLFLQEGVTIGQQVRTGTNDALAQQLLFDEPPAGRVKIPVLIIAFSTQAETISPFLATTANPPDPWGQFLSAGTSIQIGRYTTTANNVKHLPNVPQFRGEQYRVDFAAAGGARSPQAYMLFVQCPPELLKLADLVVIASGFSQP